MTRSPFPFPLPQTGGSQPTASDGTFVLEVPPDFTGSVSAKDARQPFLSARQEHVAANADDLVLRLAMPQPTGR
jgi:hypothetical protein